MNSSRTTRRAVLGYLTPLLLRGAAAPKKIVVVGAGIMGASIAYHLVKRGAKVTLVERAHPAAGTTKDSFAWINSTYSKSPKPYFDLNAMGIAHWRRVDREFNGELPLRWTGSVEWYKEAEAVAAFRAKVARHQAWGYATHWLEASEFERLLPKAVVAEGRLAAFASQEAGLDPVAAVNLIVKKAKQLGVAVEYPCEVTGLDVANGRIRGVMTTRGKLEADVVVSASGNGTTSLAKMAGVSIPLKDDPGVLAHTAPMPQTLERIALAPEGHTKQNLDGRFVTGSDFGGTPTIRHDREFGLELLASAAKVFPHLKGAKLEAVTYGHRVMPADEYPIVGFTPQVPNLYVAAMHSGITLSQLMGNFSTMEILDATRIDMLAPYRPERFA